MFFFDISGIFISIRQEMCSLAWRKFFFHHFLMVPYCRGYIGKLSLTTSGPTIEIEKWEGIVFEQKNISIIMLTVGILSCVPGLSCFSF